MTDLETRANLVNLLCDGGLENPTESPKWRLLKDYDEKITLMHLIKPNKSVLL
ncbi:MAG: hypothetical protein MR902_05505 [Campylobacter sp.]|nr:hypothetical protein [Campylobacter sp.]